MAIDRDGALETTRTAHLAAIVAAMCFPTVTTLLYFVVFAGSDWMQSLYSGSKLVQFAFPLAWVWLAQRRRVRWTRPDARSLAWGAGFGVLTVALMLGAYYGYFKHSEALARTPAMVQDKLKDMKLTSGALYLLFAAFLCVPHALLEEYYWRWFCFGQLRRVTPVAAAAVISGLAFMSHHVIVIWAYLPGQLGLVALFSLAVAVGGVAWCWIYQRAGSLYGPWVSHILVDAGIMWIGYDLAYRT